VEFKNLRQGTTMKNYNELTTAQEKIFFIQNIETFHKDGRPYAKERDLNLNLLALQQLMTIEDEVYIHFIEETVNDDSAQINMEKLLHIFRNVVTPDHFQNLIEASNPIVFQKLKTLYSL